MNQDLKQNRLLTKHVIGRIKEISIGSKDIDSKIISKSIPSTDIIDDHSDISEYYVWASIYGDEDKDKGIRKHVISYNGIDNDVLMTIICSHIQVIIYFIRSYISGTTNLLGWGILKRYSIKRITRNHKDNWTSCFDANEIDYNKKR